MDALLTRWLQLFPAADEPSARSAGRELLARWSQPHRRYHDLSHLAAVLDAVDLLGGEARDPQAVRLAAWFHDAVHDGRAGDDEVASAALAEHVLSDLRVPPVLATEVVRLVLLTTAHDPGTGDADGAVLCDADLSVLGGSPEEYAAYAAAIRAEYSAVPDAEFRAGRAAVLESLVGRDPMFRTAGGRERWEARARRNVRTELALLRAGASDAADPPP